MLKRYRIILLALLAIVLIGGYFIYSNPLAKRWVINKISFKETKHNEKFDMSTYSGNVIKDISFAENVKTNQNKLENLQLDIYLPEGADTTKQYPLVLCIHSGGFLVGNKEQTANLCAGFAKNGFVAATLNYRLGWGKDRNLACDGDSLELKKAIYRAVQDTRASLRFLVHNASKFSIDTNWIFVQGASAGAVTTLHTAFMSQINFEKFLPKNVITSLGGIDNSGNPFADRFSIKAICNCWGSFCDASLIDTSNAVPGIFFHGAQDKVTPFEKGNVYSCDKFMTAYGSKTIYDRLQQLKVPAIAHFEKAMGHNLAKELFYMNNAICFFKKIVNNEKITSAIYNTTEPSCKH